MAHGVQYSYYTYAQDATAAIGITNKYIADIQTNVTGDKPLEFWRNRCPKKKSIQPAISFGC